MDHVTEQSAGRIFRLAPMSAGIRGLSVVLLALPPVFLIGALLGKHLLVLPALLIITVYAWVWLRFRPSRFVVRGGGLSIVWPLKHREVPSGEITDVRLLNRSELQQSIGWGLRIGAGGLWGGFGWLWTKRRGIVQMYVSRTDGFVWIERTRGRPLLITPEEPEDFVRGLSS
jgi:hypothetical protein